MTDISTWRNAVVRSDMFGHAIVDAMGVLVEFSDRSQHRRDPVTGYRGYGMRTPLKLRSQTGENEHGFR